MKIDFTVPLKTLIGDEMVISPDDPRKFTMAVAIATALSTQGDPTISPSEAVTRYELAKELMAAEGEIDLSLEDLLTIKTVVTKGYAPLISGQIVKHLEG